MSWLRIQGVDRVFRTDKGGKRSVHAHTPRVMSGFGFGMVIAHVT